MIWNSASDQKSTSFNLRYMTIKDKPKYAWRGFHIDVSRHFFSKEYIIELIDWLAYYKFNKLQLHLTDDQGWRIEIDQFPLLTEIGAWRTFNSMDSTCMELSKSDINYTIDPRFIKEKNGQKIYGGFYTKQDIREIVAYASANYIDVIPEVDMPGHMSAAIKAYPQLSCVDSAGWGTEFSFPICPCNPDVMDFSYKVWDEIIELFPSNVVHIGCDEVEKATWAASPECRLFMKENGMTSLNEIQNYFVKKMQEHLRSKGKTVIAWDDVIDGNVDSKITMMYWRDWVTDSPERSAANGNPIILTPWSHFYLSSTSNDENLQKLYYYNPANLFPANVMSKVQGMHGCVWTEEIPSEAVFEKQVFPRIQALAEVCWTPGRDWHSFQVRMKPHFSYMNSKNIHYLRPGWAD
jgi:hexosaminidase